MQVSGQAREEEWWESVARLARTEEEKVVRTTDDDGRDGKRVAGMRLGREEKECGTEKARMQDDEVRHEA